MNVPARVGIALLAACGAGAALAQDYAAPRPGTVMQFSVARVSAAANERMAVTIRAVERDTVSTSTASGRAQYLAKLARGIFTVEIAEAAIVYRHDYQPAALAKLWPLAAGRSVNLSGKLLAAPAADFKPKGDFAAIGSYEARFTVRERMPVITAAGPYDVFVITRDIQRRDAQGKPLQRETGEIWFAPELGWQIRSEMRTDGPKGTTSRIDLVAVAGN